MTKIRVVVTVVADNDYDEITLRVPRYTKDGMFITTHEILIANERLSTTRVHQLAQAVVNGVIPLNATFLRPIAGAFRRDLSEFLQFLAEEDEKAVNTLRYSDALFCD